MDEMRRRLVQSGGRMTLLGLLLAAGWLKPEQVLAQTQIWNKAAFDTHSLADTMKALGGGDPVQSKDIVFFQTPEIAENGAVVPIGVTSNIPKTEANAILIEKNPNLLAAAFEIPTGTEASTSTRATIADSANVYALVKA